MKFRYIKKLEILDARYLLEDSKGNKVILDIDYFRGRTSKMRFVKGSGKRETKKDFLNELRKFASNLLKRKAGVNLVK